MPNAININSVRSFANSKLIHIIHCSENFLHSQMRTLKKITGSNKK